MFVRPADPKFKVLDPEATQAAGRSRYLPADGADVPDNDYWRERVDAGDVVTADGSAPAPKAAPKSRAPKPKPAAKA